MKKFVALPLLLAMLLTACGNGGADANVGFYEAAYAEAYGLTIAIEDVYENGFSLELKNRGRATFHYEGSDYNLKWTLEGERFHAEGGGAALDGTLNDGVLRLEDVLGSGIRITLNKQS